MHVISSIPIKGVPTWLSIDSKGSVAFVGSDKGVMRIYDISQRPLPRLLKMRKFF